GAVLEAVAADLGGPRVAQHAHAGGRGAVGRLHHAGDRLAGAQRDALEERPAAELLVLADHAQGVAEVGLRGVVGVLDVQLDVEVALGRLLRRDGEAVLALGVRLVLRLLEDLVLALRPRVAQQRAAHGDGRPADRLAGVLVRDLAGVLERLALGGRLGRLLLSGLVLFRGAGVEADGADGGEQNGGEAGAEAPGPAAAPLQRAVVVDQHDDPPVEVGVAVADTQGQSGRPTRTRYPALSRPVKGPPGRFRRGPPAPRTAPAGPP